jgi:hypothetical protein
LEKVVTYEAMVTAENNRIYCALEVEETSNQMISTKS